LLRVADDPSLPQRLSPRVAQEAWPPSGVTLYYSMVRQLTNPAGSAVGPVTPALAVRAAGAGLLGLAAGLLGQRVLLQTAPPAGLWRVAILLLPLHGGAAAGALLELSRAGPARSWLAAGAFGRPRRPAVWRLLLATPGLLAGVSLVHWMVAGLARLAALEPARPGLLEALAGVDAAGVLAASAILVLWVPLVEEVLFRLLLTDALAAGSVRCPGVWSAALFALAHGVPAHAPGLFAFGLALQHLRRRYGGLWAPLLAHALYNGLAAAGWLLLAQAG
jgi:uncharacterized protein